ncbi:MAG: hypothetical protein HYV19_07470 [Gemmatimonadetes bacterium]|nr:hypothetical protein [Gemmatimonadota bacterium]
MRTTARFLIAPALLLLAAAPARAAAPNGGDDKPVPVALEEAERLAVAGQLRDAEKAYREIVAHQRAMGQYPAEALRGAATTAYMRGDLRAAARTFDELAATANEVGDFNNQVLALVDASYLYTALRDRPAVSHRVARVQALIENGAVCEEVRKGVEERIGER